jgi:hypothetical protein
MVDLTKHVLKVSGIWINYDLCKMYFYQIYFLNLIDLLTDIFYIIDKVVFFK